MSKNCESCSGNTTQTAYTPYVTTKYPHRKEFAQEAKQQFCFESLVISPPIWPLAGIHSTLWYFQNEKKEMGEKEKSIYPKSKGKEKFINSNTKGK